MKRLLLQLMLALPIKMGANEDAATTEISTINAVKK